MDIVEDVVVKAYYGNNRLLAQARDIKEYLNKGYTVSSESLAQSIADNLIHRTKHITFIKYTNQGLYL